MKRALILLSLFLAACASTPPDNSVRVSMVTTGGTLTLKLLPDVAPRTVEQFKRLIAAGVFDGVYFYRVEKNFVAQTAMAQYDRATPLTPEQRALLVPIPLENGSLLHKRGVLSLAHGDDPNSGETSFSILLADAPHLDGKFTIFGVLDDSDAALKSIEEHYNQQAKDAAGNRLQIVKMEIIGRK